MVSFPTGRRRLVLGGAAVAVVLSAGVIAVVSLGGDDAEDGFAAVPKVSNDRLAALFAPAMPLPTKCGNVISREVAAELAPKAKAGNASSVVPGQARCVWKSNDKAEEVGGKRRVLQTKIIRAESVPEALEEFRRQRDALHVYYRDRDKGKTVKEDWSKPEAVTGIGEEAVFNGRKQRPATYVTVVFRVKNLVAQVEYYAADYSGGIPTQPSWQSQRPHVFAAAADVARNLGAAGGGKPAIAEPVAAARPVQKLPDPCGVLAAPTLDRLGSPEVGAPVRNEKKPGFDEEGLQSRTEVASCGWRRDDGLGGFKVLSILTPDEVPGMGADIARRQHLAGFPAPKEDATFSLLSGPGEEASVKRVAAGECPTRPRDAGCAAVQFRVRNVLTSVWYAGASEDGKALSFDQMSRRAYAIATDAAKAIPVA